MGRTHGWNSRAAAKWRRSSPLLRFAWVLSAYAAGWFLINVVLPVGPVGLLWISTPLCAAASTGIFWQASRNAALPAVGRRFWRHLTPAAALVGVGQTTQAADAVRNNDGGNHLGPVVLGCYGIAILLIIYALYRLPTGQSGSLRVSLDAGAVMLATAVFIWHFGTRRDIGVSTGSALAWSLALIVLASFVVFTLMKVLFADYAVVDRAGLRLLAMSALAGALEPMLQPLLDGYGGRLYVSQVGVPLIFLLAAEAAARQSGASVGARRPNRLRRRSFSLFPYVAVAAVDGLLIWVACFDLSDIVVVAAAAVALTAIVVMRQVLSLVANGRLVEQLDHSANHDPLTGLPNRSFYNRRLQQALAAPADRPVALALIDLDDFKMVNDTLGHEVGDALLVEVAGRLRGCVRDGDTVARLGGDEFVMILDGGTGAVIERVLAAFGEPVRAAGHTLPVRASVGIADGRSGDDPSMLLRQADMAMYAAKDVPGTAARHHDESTTASFLAGVDRAARR